MSIESPLPPKSQPNATPNLVGIAVAQRQLIIAIIIGVIGVAMKIPIAMAVIGLYQAFRTYKLGEVLSEKYLWIHTLISLFPGIGILSMAALSQKATHTLKCYGIKVGFLGAEGI